MSSKGKSPSWNWASSRKRRHKATSHPAPSSTSKGTSPTTLRLSRLPPQNNKHTNTPQKQKKPSYNKTRTNRLFFQQKQPPTTGGRGSPGVQSAAALDHYGAKESLAEGPFAPCLNLSSDPPLRRYQTSKIIIQFPVPDKPASRPSSTLEALYNRAPLSSCCFLRPLPLLTFLLPMFLFSFRPFVHPLVAEYEYLGTSHPESKLAVQISTSGKGLEISGSGA